MVAGVEGHAMVERLNKAKVMATGVAVADAVTFALSISQQPEALRTGPRCSLT